MTNICLYRGMIDDGKDSFYIKPETGHQVSTPLPKNKVSSLFFQFLKTSKHNFHSFVNDSLNPTSMF